ncbi:LacI family DNA-binding transcriptional regulator [Jannaschia sp. M317]|uniref:LacI family DNA-binding transcriptional regulator n=1 Tax=Jannaschia sp. M317 TaxID=2867011 RepID=UPI0021A2D2FD|nr:LacI family DNA-binding transcriptional regulator [Jannaschia sp. M317]
MPDRAVESMPTTKDLAKAAGVSRATVDRVLNGRDGVRQKTVDRVNQAIRDLGFERNIAAANLAKRRSYRFLFVLPRTGDLFLRELVSRISDAANAFARDGIRAEVAHLDTNDPHALANHLTGLAPGEWDGVALMAPRSPQLRDAARRLTERGTHVLPFISAQARTDGAPFVGIDNRAAGATAGLLMGRFIGRKQGKVLVVADTMRSQDSLDRRHGFDSQLTAYHADLSGLPSLETGGTPDRTQAVIGNALRFHGDILGIYLLGSEARLALEALGALDLPEGVVCIAHERTTATEAALRDGCLDAVITQDPGHLVRSAFRRLKALSDNSRIFEAQEKIRTEVLLPTNL